MKKEFKTIDELISDPNFIQFVDKNINELRKNRNKRPDAKPGFHYKRDWYDRMIDDRSLNSPYFIRNIESIWNKKSSLSSEIRNVILFVCGRSLQETFLEYSKQVDSENLVVLPSPTL